ncbi:PDZ and LIM domain protein 7 [Lissotriton helveticus]
MDMESYKVTLDGPAPWGFRLQGGKDFSMPLSISRLSPGGKSELAGVNVGDWVLSIDGESTSSMTHIEAQNKIRSCTDKLSLSLSSAEPLEEEPQNKKTPDLGWMRRIHPAYLANDSSKKRLVEDTEDWQPRTGTAQSRSFRILAQLTDTDFMQDPDDEHVKKAREKFITELQSPRYTRLRDWHHERSACSLNVKPNIEASHIVTYNRVQKIEVQNIESQDIRTGPGDVPDMGHVPPAQRPPPTGPAVRPPWAIDPTFAERYAPDKTTTVLTKHSQPATLTPMQNRNSIVQAAQQPPESGTRTPICYQCNKIIRGRYLVALGQYYHPEEFTCSQCRKVLEEGGFFEEKGSIFCPKCYDVRFAPNCAKCKKKITGEIMHALKMAWHVQCFTCAACKTPIRNRAFYMEEGRPYCEKDFEVMFGTKCRGCDFKIDAGDRFLEALGYSWHDTCFVCAICQINLEGKTFYSKKDKPLCKTHAFSPV